MLWCHSKEDNVHFMRTIETLVSTVLMFGRGILILRPKLDENFVFITERKLFSKNPNDSELSTEVHDDGFKIISSTIRPTPDIENRKTWGMYASLLESNLVCPVASGLVF